MLAERIKYLRESNKFSQKELGKKVYMNQSQISKIEKCERKVAVEELPLFAEALGVTVQELLGKTKEPA